MADLTPELLDRLEQLAKAATPGPWSTEKPPRNSDGWQQGVTIGATRGGMIYATPPGGQYPLADAKFIAAASPDVMLALIAAARRTVASSKATTIAELFASRIREEGLASYLVAERLRMSPTTVSDILYERKLPGPKVQRKLARFLRLTFEQLAAMVAEEKAQPISLAEALP